MNGASDVVRVEAIITNGEEENLRPLSEIKFDASIEQVFQQMDALLPASDFKPAIDGRAGGLLQGRRNIFDCLCENAYEDFSEEIFLLIDPYDPKSRRY